MKNTKGFTLMEVVISLAVFSIVMAAVLASMVSGQSSFDEASVHASLETNATIIMDNLCLSLPECKIVSSPVTATGHASMTIQVPVALTGTFWSDDGSSINWGAKDQLDWTMTYQFVLDETIYETTTSIDYNKDGDTDDAFDIGEMQLIFKDDSAVTQLELILGENIIVTSGAWDGDVDGDGDFDPIFLRVNSMGQEDFINGVGIIINLWMCKLTPEGNVVLINKNDARVLRNPQ